MILALALQTSLLAHPQYRDAEPPDSRSLRVIAVQYTGARGAPESLTVPRERARAEIEALLADLRDGASFDAIARARSDHHSAEYGGLLGTFFPGLLTSELDEFLFSAEVGAFSEIFDTPFGFQLAQRIDTEAACRQISIHGVSEESRAKTERLLLELRDGASFADLAKEHSDDPESAARGGALGIYERGRRDRLLKKALFELEVGEISEAIETPLGFSILQRVPLDELDPELRRREVSRLRGILIASNASTAFADPPKRDGLAAQELATEIAERIRAGEDMARLAEEFNDDPGGKERLGDLGWVRRESPQTAGFMDRAFLAEVGELVGPIPTSEGWVIVRREQ